MPTVLTVIAGIERLLKPFDPVEQRQVLRFIMSRVHSGSNGGSTHGSKADEPQNEPPVQNQVQIENEPPVQTQFEQRVVTTSYASSFDDFWKLYPRKQGKKDAKRIYLKLKPDKDLQARILQAILEQKASEQWTTENGRFIPLPKTWLNRGSWDDEPQVQIENEPRFGRTSSSTFKRFIERG